MRAVLLPGNGEVLVTSMARPSPGSYEVLVETRASAICRSDMSIYHGDPVLGKARGADDLRVPGHEAAGVVVGIGESVRDVSVGDHVAGYLAVSAPRGEFARRGRPMLDPGWACLGFDLHGGDADYFVLPEANCLPIPDDITFSAAAVMTDMIGTQYSTQKRLGVSGRHTVAVIGLGPMGAAAVMVAKANGARVIAVDLVESRRSMARALGADSILDSSQTEIADGIDRLTGGRGAEIVLECSGNPSAQTAALDAAAKLGSVAFVGESKAATISPTDHMIHKLLTLTGGWYFAIDEWSEIVNFVQRHALPVEDLISHRYDLAEAKEAFRAFDQREAEKSVFVW